MNRPVLAFTNPQLADCDFFVGKTSSYTDKSQKSYNDGCCIYGCI